MAGSIGRITLKAHASPMDAFNCHKRWLITRGFKQIGPREFRPPDGGPIEVLTKKSRFGARLRTGKGKRLMGHRHTSGVIIG